MRRRGQARRHRLAPSDGWAADSQAKIRRSLGRERRPGSLINSGGVTDTMIKIGKLLFGTALAAALLAGPASAETTTMRFSVWIPMTHPVHTDIYVPWAKEVEQATEGRVKIEFVSALGAPPAHFDLVKNGVADVAMPVHDYTPNRFTLTKLFELPFISDNSIAPSLAAWHTQQKFFAKANEHAGVHLLSLWTHGPADIYMATNPVTKLADIKNKKIRVAGGMSDIVAKELGATPFFAPASGAYDALSKGVADGILFPAESVPSFKLDKIIRYGTMVPGGLYESSHYMIMNEAKYKSLSKKDQAAIDKVSGEALAKLAGTVWDKINTRGTEIMKASGVQIVTADAAFMADLHKLLDPIEGEWIKEAAKKGVDGKAALAYFKSEIKRVNASMMKK
jgi:TRAP-type C4-dicarboxylate transport system substrate-binding protein